MQKLRPLALTALAGATMVPIVFAQDDQVTAPRLKEMISNLGF